MDASAAMLWLFIGAALPAAEIVLPDLGEPVSAAVHPLAQVTIGDQAHGVMCVVRHHHAGVPNSVFVGYYPEMVSAAVLWDRALGAYGDRVMQDLSDPGNGVRKALLSVGGKPVILKVYDNLDRQDVVPEVILLFLDLAIYPHERPQAR